MQANPAVAQPANLLLRFSGCFITQSR